MDLPGASGATAFFEYTDEDRELLAALGPLLEKQAEALVARFYRHLLSFPETRAHLSDPAVTRRLLGAQRRYLLSLAGPVIDEAYLAERQRIGEIHNRQGIEPHWYLGAYALYLSLLTPLVCQSSGGDLVRAERTLAALQKLLLFDASIAMQQYIRARHHDLEYLNEELARSGRRLAHELEETDAALRSTADRARAAERLASIGTLVAGLAHEIGTPMGVIQGHAKLLEPAVQDEGARWRLRTIQDQIGRISRIIQGLLNMARPSRSRRGPVVLAPLLDNTLVFLTEKLARCQIEVVRAFGPVPSVRGDAERLQQLFLNLFVNAADAMEAGGTLRVALSVPSEGEVEIRVADTGSGIAPAHLARIFDPFFTTKPAGEGHGLGLAVAQGIVADHAGSLEVTRSNEQGTELRVVLPAA
jgi:signal transduction histidine kinase